MNIDLIELFLALTKSISFPNFIRYFFFQLTLSEVFFHDQDFLNHMLFFLHFQCDVEKEKYNLTYQNSH